MYRHNYPDQPRSNSRASGGSNDRPGSRNRDFDQHHNNYGHPSHGHGQNYDNPSHGYDQGYNRPHSYQPMPPSAQGFAPPLMSIQVRPDGPAWQNNTPHLDMTDNHPSSSIIRYRSRSPEHRLINRSFSPDHTLVTTDRNQGQQLPDKVYECLGTVVLVQDFLECGVLQMKGADGRTANCLFFRKDVLVHARRERLSIETPHDVLFKANAWMMNRSWPVPYLAASVWMEGADIPPVVMAKIFQPPDSRTVELYQSLANDLAWQIPKEPVVRNPIFGQPGIAQRNVVLIDEEVPRARAVSPGRKVVFVDGVERFGSRRSDGLDTSGRDMVELNPMAQLRDSIRYSKQEQEEVPRSWSPMGQFRESLQVPTPQGYDMGTPRSQGLGIPRGQQMEISRSPDMLTSRGQDILTRRGQDTGEVSLVSPVSFHHHISRSPRMRSRSRSRNNRYHRSRSPNISSKRSRSPRRRSRSVKRRSRSPRRRSPRKRSRSHNRSNRKSRSRSAKRRRSKSKEKSRRSRSRGNPGTTNTSKAFRNDDNKPQSKDIPERIFTQCVYLNGASAKVKSYMNEEIGVLTIMPGQKQKIGKDVLTTQRIYFHVDQVWVKTSSIGMHQFREVYQTKDLKKRFPVDMKVLCNVRKIRSEEAEFQAIVVCREGYYEEWKQKLSTAEGYLQHSLDYNLSVIKYMESRHKECIKNPFLDKTVVAVEAKVHEYFSLDVGFLKLCGGDLGVVLFNTNQVHVPATAVKAGKSWTRLKTNIDKLMEEHLPLGMSVDVVLSPLPCHGCSQLKYQALAVYKKLYNNLVSPVQDFNKHYAPSNISVKLQLKKTLESQFDTFKRLSKLENNSLSASFSPVHAVLNGLPQGWQALVVAVVNTEFGIIRVSKAGGEPLYNKQGVSPTMLHVLFHIDNVYDVHGFKASHSNMSMESLTDQYVDLTARTICKRNKPLGIFEVQHLLAMENAAYVGIPLLQAIVVCVKMNEPSAPITRSVPKPTVLRKEPGNFDSEVSAFYLQYGLKVKLDIKLVQFVAVKNKPPLPYQKHIVSTYSYKEEKEVLEGLRSIDTEASQQLIYGKLSMKDTVISQNPNLPQEISRIECNIKFLHRSNLKAEKGIVEIKPLVGSQTTTCLAYFQYSDLYRQQEQDFQCKDLAVLMPVSSKDKFCVSVHLWKPGHQVPYFVTVIWNESLRLKLAMPEPRPAPFSAETFSYREPLIKEVLASCQDDIEVVTEAAPAPVPKIIESATSNKKKVPAKAGKAAAGVSEVCKDFVSLNADGSVVEYFDNCEATVEKVIGEHYLVLCLSESLKDVKKIRVLASSTDVVASYAPESLDTITKVSNAKAAHTGINLYDLAKPGDKARFNACLLATKDSTIQYFATCVVIDPKRYMAKLVGPSNSEDLVKPLTLPKFVPLLAVKSSKQFGTIWKETFQKIVLMLDGDLVIVGTKVTKSEALRILSNKAPSKCTGMELRNYPKIEVQEARKSRSKSHNKETAASVGSGKPTKQPSRHNLIVLTDDVNNDKILLDPFKAHKIYGRVIKILNPNYGIGICQKLSADGSLETFQVLFDIFDVWIDDQVVAKMEKKLPDVMVVGDYIQLLSVKVEEGQKDAKRVVEYMATAVAIAKTYNDVKTKKFPAAVVPLESIELIDENKIVNFKKVVQILKGMEPDIKEKKIIEEVKEEMKDIFLSPKKNKIHGNKKNIKDLDITQNIFDKFNKSKEMDAPTKKEGNIPEQTKEVIKVISKSREGAQLNAPSERTTAVFSNNVKDHTQNKNESNIKACNKLEPIETLSDSIRVSDIVINIFTVKVIKNIEGSYWLGQTISEKIIKRVVINTVKLEKTLLVEEGMILNCDISDVELEDPVENNQVYHIAHSVKLNPNDEILLDDKKWKPKTKQTKYQPIVDSVCNLEFTRDQCCQLLGLGTEEDQLVKKALPKVLVNETGVIVHLIDDTTAIIRLRVQQNDVLVLEENWLPPELKVRIDQRNASCAVLKSKGLGKKAKEWEDWEKEKKNLVNAVNHAKQKAKRGNRYLHILVDNAFRSNVDIEFYPKFIVGYPVTFHAVRIKGNEERDIQFLATDICLHLDPERYKDFLDKGNQDFLNKSNPVSIESTLIFPKFKQVLEKLSLIDTASVLMHPARISYTRMQGIVKAFDNEVILIEHSFKKDSKELTLYIKSKSEKAPKTALRLSKDQKVVFNFVRITQDTICGLVTELWTPEAEAKEGKGLKGLQISSIDNFHLKVARLMSPAYLQHVIPQSFLKFQSKYSKENLQSLIWQYVESLEECVELEGVKMPAPIYFQTIVSGANFEISILDAKEFLMLLGDICQDSIGPKNVAFWDVVLGRDFNIGNLVISCAQALAIKTKGLVNVIKVLPRTRQGLLNWRLPEDWSKNVKQYSSLGVDISSPDCCPAGWSRVDDSKLLAGALEHGLLYGDLKSQTLWSNLADDQGYGLGSRIFKEETLQQFVVERLNYLVRVAEGGGRYCSDCSVEDESLQICCIDTVKEEDVIGRPPLFSRYDLNSIESSSSEEATLVIKEELLDLDDSSSVSVEKKHQESQSIDSVCNQLGEEMNILGKALEEMEKAAAVVEESYDSEVGDQTNSDNLQRSILSHSERFPMPILNGPSVQVAGDNYEDRETVDREALVVTGLVER